MLNKNKIAIEAYTKECKFAYRNIQDIKQRNKYIEGNLEMLIKYDETYIGLFGMLSKEEFDSKFKNGDGYSLLEYEFKRFTSREQLDKCINECYGWAFGYGAYLLNEHYFKLTKKQISKAINTIIANNVAYKLDNITLDKLSNHYIRKLKKHCKDNNLNFNYKRS